MLATLLFSHVLYAPVSHADVAPAKLRVEYLVNPIGLGEQKPRLSWIVESPQRGAVQSAYRVLVASSPQLLKQGVGDLWDSGRVTSDQTAHVEYGGKPLATGQRVFWKVATWGSGSGAPHESKPAFWQMGLLSPTDWKAKWISMAEDGVLRPDTTGAKWIWYPEGNPAVTAPEHTTRHFRVQFDVQAGDIESAVLGFAIDDSLTAKLNGKQIASGSGWQTFTNVDIKSALKAGTNVLEIDAVNDTSRAGLLIAGTIKFAGGASQNIQTTGKWEASIDGSSWKAAMELAPIDGEPYGKTKWPNPPRKASYFRRDFLVAKPIKRVTAYASAKGLYQMFVDGKRVSSSFLTPGWTDFNKRIQYQAYDLTGAIKQGRHTVGMVVGEGWYRGKIAWMSGECYGTKIMALAQIEVEYQDGTKDTVVTDSSWKASTGPILSNDLQLGETYDARLELGNWTDPNRIERDIRGRNVETADMGAAEMVAQQSPTVAKLQEIKPKAMTHPTPDSYVLDLGQNMVGWARLRVSGEAGKTVRLRFAEMLNPDGTIYTTNLRGAKATDYYTLKGQGTEVYEPTFTFHGFRYVEIVGYPGVPNLSSITGVVVGSDNPKTGTFACSSPLVNQLQSNIFWGQRGNYLEVPTDCPQRDERLGWMGDAQIFARTATYNNDVAAFLTKWTQDVVDAQSADGGFSDVSPRMGDPNDGAPAWGDAGVIVPYTVYRAYGDQRLLEKHYPAMQKWISYIHDANPDHIWVNRTNNNFGDWLNANDDTPREVLATAFFAHSTDLVANIAAVLGKTEDVAKYRDLHNKIKAAFVAKFVDADGKILGDSQTAYVVALQFHLIPDSMRENATKRLVDHIMIDRKGHLSTGFLGVGYLNPTLTSMGRSDVAYKLLLNDTYPSWGYSIRQGATTIWERWDGWTKEKGFQDPGMNSFNHYSLGSVGEWMYASVAGIDLDEKVPGYKKIVVKPIPGGEFKWAKATLDSMHGKIESGWKVSGKRFELNVVVPANTKAIIYVPAASESDVTEGEVLASAAEGVRFVRMENGRAVYEVGGGKYHFKSKMAQ